MKSLHIDEDEICRNIELYDLDWVYDAYKFIMESKYDDRTWDTTHIVMARTPQSKEGVKAMQNYMKSVDKYLERQLIPWRKKSNYSKSASNNDGERGFSDSNRPKSKNPVESKVILEGAMPKDVMDFFSNIDVAVEKRKGV